MRMDSRPTVHVPTILSIAFICLVVGARIDAQVPSVGNPDPFEPSPLSQFVPTKTPQVEVNRFGLMGSTENPVVTQKIDLSETLKKFAAIRNCSLDEAFAETVAYLKMVPIRDFSKSGQPMVGTQAIYKIVEKDVYQIAASPTFFANLPQHLMCLENGKRHIVLEARFLSIIPGEIESLQEFMIPNSFEAFTNKIPQTKPFATQASYKNSESSTDQTSDAGTFVIATETKTIVHPSFMGRLNSEGLKKLLVKLKETPGVEYTRPPRITVLPGQIASISDTDTKPVVVGLDRIVSDFATAHQPIIQTLENGSVMQLRATGQDGKIRIDGDLALSEVTSVGKFQYPKIINDDGEPPIVAVPEFKLKEVHWSTLVVEGQTILIDPVFTKWIHDPKSKIGTKPVLGRVVILVTPRFVAIEPRPRR